MYTKVDFENYYFDYLIYHQPDGVSLKTYCLAKGISYDSMAGWLSSISERADDNGTRMSPEEKSVINQRIMSLISELRRKEDALRVLQAKVDEMERILDVVQKLQ